MNDNKDESQNLFVAWKIAWKEGEVDRLEYSAKFEGQRVAAVEGSPIRAGSTDILRAAKPASVIFLIGILLLGITTILAWDLRPPVARDSAGGSLIVDELGLFGQSGVVVQLNREQTDAYIAAQLDQRRGSLLLCIAVGSIALAGGALLIAWQEIKEQRSPPGLET